MIQTPTTASKCHNSYRRKVQGRVERASDCYSLARIAYQFFTQPVSGQLDPSLPDACKEVLERGLAWHPADRFSSVGAFVEELERSFGFR